MRRTLIGLVTLLLLALLPLAQAQTNVKVAEVAPDCNLWFSLSAVGNSTDFDNRTNGCKYWTVAYVSNGFTAVSVAVRAAPDNVGAPGAYADWPGTVILGVNPNVATTQASSQLGGYYPWVCVRLGSKTGAGTVAGRLYGWREQGALTVAIPGTVVGYLGCNLSAAFNLAGAGSTQIVALSGTKTIRVCHISMSTVAGEDIKLVQGTGVNCVTGPADLTGLYKNALTIALDLNGTLSTAAGQALCVNQSVAQATGGVVTYTQQ
jgi:hypothetical protein